ncbi:hypothetical protein [Spirillospora sp. CA-294931]|uniref:hypothetical protein n=1 Tax=Spirillospora sp. CA-294931 TaxID=3240042 RepID=UPI003D8EB37F
MTALGLAAAISVTVCAATPAASAAVGRSALARCGENPSDWFDATGETIYTGKPWKRIRNRPIQRYQAKLEITKGEGTWTVDNGAPAALGKPAFDPHLSWNLPGGGWIQLSNAKCEGGGTRVTESSFLDNNGFYTAYFPRQK